MPWDRITRACQQIAIKNVVIEKPFCEEADNGQEAQQRLMELIQGYCSCVRSGQQAALFCRGVDPVTFTEHPLSGWWKIAALQELLHSLP